MCQKAGRNVQEKNYESVRTEASSSKSSSESIPLATQSDISRSLTRSEKIHDPYTNHNSNLGDSD